MMIPLPPLEEQHKVLARIEELTARIHTARALRHQATEEAGALYVAWLRSAILDSPAEEVDLEQACEAIIDNLHTNPRYSSSGVPCVRSSDVGWGTLNLVDALRTDEAEYRRRTVRGTPRSDDIVLVREGGGTGKCALVLPGQRFSLGQRVMILRPNKTSILPTFLLYQLLSPLVQEDQIVPLCKGSASPHLNIGLLRRFRLRLPSVSDQRRVVAQLDAAHTKVGALRRQHAETAAELDALLPAILDRAFKGEL
jgi:type I restriction enzyme S subunit